MRQRMSRRKVKHFKDFQQIAKNNEQKPDEDEDWKEKQESLVLSQMIRARTTNQERYINSLLSNVITFIIGPAGTGKTSCACGIAARLLYEKKIDKIILTRPQVEVGSISQGFYPGSPTEKIIPYIIPMIDSLGDFLGHKSVDKLIKEEIIQIIPLGLVRGRSIKNAMILADEVQSCRYIELKTLLTRVDLNSRLVLMADIEQSDLKEGAKDFNSVIHKLKDLKDEIGFIKLDISDCQRAGIVKKILERL